MRKAGRSAWMVSLAVLAVLAQNRPLGATSEPRGAKIKDNLYGVACVSALECWAVGVTASR
jgi:hypothetical protein